MVFLMQDALQLRQWIDSLNLSEHSIKGTSRICEKHFNYDDIVRYDEKLLKSGQIIQLPRHNIKLKPDAIPTLFPTQSYEIEYIDKENQVNFIKKKVIKDYNIIFYKTCIFHSFNNF